MLVVKHPSDLVKARALLALVRSSQRQAELQPVSETLAGSAELDSHALRHIQSAEPGWVEREESWAFRGHCFEGDNLGHLQCCFGSAIAMKAQTDAR